MLDRITGIDTTWQNLASIKLHLPGYLFDWTYYNYPYTSFVSGYFEQLPASGQAIKIPIVPTLVFTGIIILLKIPVLLSIVLAMIGYSVGMAAPILRWYAQRYTSAKNRMRDEQTSEDDDAYDIPNFEEFYRQYSRQAGGNSGQQSYQDSGARRPGPTKDLYSVLGISSTASTTEIKRAFITAAKRYHPDTVQGSANEKELASKRFQEVSSAYDVLRDCKCVLCLFT